jgi:F-type H+-transporting ATPase subunit b
MLQRRRHRIGAIVCALTFVLVVVSLAWAAGAGEGHDGGLINLDRSLIIQLFNFLLLLWLLHRFLYKPLLAKMQERTGAIQKSLEEAQVARAQAAKQQEENAERLRAAHAEAEAIRARALKEAAEEQRKLVEAARAESQRMVESAKAQLETETRRAREDLRREVADLAVAVAERLVRKSLRDEDHRRIVAEAVARIGRS